ncbi:MAG: tagaturonate reductase [Enterococcus sp.]
MKEITDIVVPDTKFPTKVIQFGEGNFLRAFVDWQIQQVNNHGLFEGGVAIVQPLPQGMIQNLEAQNNRYTVVLEGLLEGQVIQSDECITCINTTVDPYKEFERYLELADCETIEVIFSNTTEAGIAFDPTDRFDAQPAHTYPGKLTQLLYRRFKNGLKGFSIIPCELIEHNGDKLKETVLQYAALWELEPAFSEWIQLDNEFYSTLVDRIVPGFPHDTKEEVFERIGYSDPLLVKAEPFLLFVIEGNPQLAEQLPFAKVGLNVILTEDITPYRERKVRLLNGPHTTMTPIGLLAGVETVGEMMKDADFAPFIADVMEKEIAPMIQLPREELSSYIEAIKERFANPFVEHALSAISLNSISKFKSRLLPSLLQNLETTNQVPQRITLALASLFVIYGEYDGITVAPIDTDEVIETFRRARKQDNYIQTILQDTTLWGEDLTSYPELVNQVQVDVDMILTKGVREVAKEMSKQTVL